jgi:hypothetical protein
MYYIWVEPFLNNIVQAVSDLTVFIPPLSHLCIQGYQHACGVPVRDYSGTAGSTRWQLLFVTVAGCRSPAHDVSPAHEVAVLTTVGHNVPVDDVTSAVVSCSEPSSAIISSTHSAMHSTTGTDLEPGTWAPRDEQ